MRFEDMETMRLEMGLGVNAFVRASGISKSSYYRRKRARGRARPKQAKVERRVKRLCAQQPGLGYRAIAGMLNRREKQVSPSTVFRLMKRLKLLQKAKPKRARSTCPQPTLMPEQIGLTIGLDFTRWQGCRICNVIEYQSRYCLASLAFARESADESQAAIQAALRSARQLGLPTSGIEVKSDHGSPFIAEDFRQFLAEHACGQTLAAVGRPQGMGRLERFNRSLKEQSLVFEDTAACPDVQPVLDRYRRFYNTRRPHQALGNKTPLEVIRLNRKKVVPVL
jgi:putative transposase